MARPTWAAQVWLTPPLPRRPWAGRRARVTALSPAPPAAGAAARRWWRTPCRCGAGVNGPLGRRRPQLRPSRLGLPRSAAAAMIPVPLRGAGGTCVVGEEIRASGGAGGRRATGPALARPGRPAAAGLPGAAVPGPGEESPWVGAGCPFVDRVPKDVRCATMGVRAMTRKPTCIVGDSAGFMGRYLLNTPGSCLHVFGRRCG